MGRAGQTLSPQRRVSRGPAGSGRPEGKGSPGAGWRLRWGQLCGPAGQPASFRWLEEEDFSLSSSLPVDSLPPKQLN